VTGTFDDWSKSERLDRVGQVFQKTVTFPDSSEKVFYKVSELIRSAPFLPCPLGPGISGDRDRTLN
jgi:hypothetical protein